MYLAENDQGRFGVVDPISAAFTVSSAVGALKSLFGIGKKKAALKQIAANAQGKWTSQFPEYADWEEFVNRKVPPLKKKGAGGTDTYKKQYDFWRARKDSILIKHQIASAYDYAAWLVATYGIKDGWIKPEAGPSDPAYRNGPYAIGTNIPIFDYAAITQWAASQMPQAPAPQTLAPSVIPQPLPQNIVAPKPPGATVPFLPPVAPQSFMPQAPQVSFPVPGQTAPSIARADNSSLFALAAIGGVAAYFLLKKRR